MEIYSIYDKEFETFGKAVDCPFFGLFEKGANEIAVPETGCSYMASVPQFETEESTYISSPLFYNYVFTRKPDNSTHIHMFFAFRVTNQPFITCNELFIVHRYRQRSVRATR